MALATNRMRTHGRTSNRHQTHPALQMYDRAIECAALLTHHRHHRESQWLRDQAVTALRLAWERCNDDVIAGTIAIGAEIRGVDMDPD